MYYLRNTEISQFLRVFLPTLTHAPISGLDLINPRNHRSKPYTGVGMFKLERMHRQTLKSAAISKQM